MKKLFPLIVFILLIIAGGYLAYQQFWSTPSVPVFTPYESDQLHNREGKIDPIILRNAESKIASIQKTIDGFDETTWKNQKIDNYFALAGQQQLIGRYLDAKKSLEMAIAQQYDAHIIHAYASLLYDMGAGEDALRYVDEAIAGAPDVPNFWQTKIALTNALFANNPTKIESVYREGIRATKDDVDLLTLYASYLGSHGRPAEAIQYWRQAADKNPKAKDIYESEIQALQ